MENKEKQVIKSKITKKEQSYKQKGITLVALVITVVIMLILAGVAIAAVVDGDGLFSKTREVNEAYENAVEDEGNMLQSMMNQIDKYIENPSNPIIKDPAKIGTIMTENQTFDGRIKGTYNNPIIPKGFAAINENGADWGTENGYQKGLIITDEVDQNGKSVGNEFVWVPVDGKIVKFERYDFGIGDALYEDCTETIPEELLESVNDNEGFYIARFETGEGDNKEVISKKGKMIYNKVNSQTAKTLSEQMYRIEDNEFGIISTLIYGAQWDTTLKFIMSYDVNESGYDIYPFNSTGMGNYSEGDEFESLNDPAVSGASEAFRQKNIYDLAGNVWEWTMEMYKDEERVNRGGDMYNPGNESPASYRNNTPVQTENNTHLGFRIALYVK